MESTNTHNYFSLDLHPKISSSFLNTKILFKQSSNIPKKQLKPQNMPKNMTQNHYKSKKSPNILVDNLLSPASYQLNKASRQYKSLNEKRIKEQIQSLKRTITIYKNMEVDGNTANNNLMNWFEELQYIFITSFKLQNIFSKEKQSNSKQHYQTVSSLPQKHKLKREVTINEIDSMAAKTKEIEHLKLQIQYINDYNSNLLSLIEQTSNNFHQYKNKAIIKKRECISLHKMLKQFMTDIDHIIDNINLKDSLQGSTTLERSIRRTITSIKFKIFEIQTITFP